MGRVAGKVAIVTGGASGMGRADAILLAREGARVVVADLIEKDGKAVADSIGSSAIFLRLDVTDEDNWKSVVGATVEKFGRLDILVNNAGMIALGNIVDTDLAMWRKINAVNSDGVFLGCKHGIPAMAASGGGSIINMSSVAAIHGQSFVAAYTASKAAQAHVARAMAYELRPHGIMVSSVHPVTTATEFFDVVREGVPAGEVQHYSIHDMSRFFVQRPEKVARAIGRAIGTGRTEIWTSFPTRVAAGMITAFPWMIDLAVAASRRRQRAPGQ